MAPGRGRGAAGRDVPLVPRTGRPRGPAGVPWPGERPSGFLEPRRHGETAGVRGSEDLGLGTRDQRARAAASGRGGSGRGKRTREGGE